MGCYFRTRQGRHKFKFLVGFLSFSVNILCCFLFYRDAVSDLALHFLNKMKILVVRDIERDEIEFICKVSEPCGAKEFIQAIQGKIVTNSRKM